MRAEPLQLSLEERELDASNSATVVHRCRETIAAAQQWDVALDFGSVHFLDSTAIGHLIALREFVGRHDGSLAVVRVRRRACRIFTSLGLIELLDVSCEPDHSHLSTTGP